MGVRRLYDQMPDRMCPDNCLPHCEDQREKKHGDGNKRTVPQRPYNSVSLRILAASSGDRSSLFTLHFQLLLSVDGLLILALLSSPR